MCQCVLSYCRLLSYDIGEQAHPGRAPSLLVPFPAGPRPQQAQGPPSQLALPSQQPAPASCTIPFPWVREQTMVENMHERTTNTVRPRSHTCPARCALRPKPRPTSCLLPPAAAVPWLNISVCPGTTNALVNTAPCRRSFPISGPAVGPSCACTLPVPPDECVITMEGCTSAHAQNQHTTARHPAHSRLRHKPRPASCCHSATVPWLSHYLCPNANAWMLYVQIGRQVGPFVAAAAPVCCFPVCVNDTGVRQLSHLLTHLPRSGKQFHQRWYIHVNSLTARAAMAVKNMMAKPRSSIWRTSLSDNAEAHMRLTPPNIPVGLPAGPWACCGGRRGHDGQRKKNVRPLCHS